MNKTRFLVSAFTMIILAIIMTASSYFEGPSFSIIIGLIAYSFIILTQNKKDGYSFAVAIISLVLSIFLKENEKLITLPTDVFFSATLLITLFFVVGVIGIFFLAIDAAREFRIKKCLTMPVLFFEGITILIVSTQFSNVLGYILSIKGT